MKLVNRKCSICESKIVADLNGWNGGHNSWPVNDDKCCGYCNDTVVLPARMMIYFKEQKQNKKER